MKIHYDGAAKYLYDRQERMKRFTDSEFGEITILRTAQARKITVRVASNGTLRISTHLYTPLFSIKRVVQGSREELRSLLLKQTPDITYKNGMIIGKSHWLVITDKDCQSSHFTVKKQQLILVKPFDVPTDHHSVQRTIRDGIIAVLRKQARSYLPKRISFLAEKYGYQYNNLRFSHSSGRWGSCSSRGTISLNIALMKLPFELIDYVLIHELCHTKQMNHSAAFWNLVAIADPFYLTHRTDLKQMQPTI